MTNLTPEVREAIEGTLHIAEANLEHARAQYDLRTAQFEEARLHKEAAWQTVRALRATLEVEPTVDDKFKTFGEG